MASLLTLTAAITEAGAPISEDTETCLECHANLHPGIVEAWRQSRHAATTPAEALKAKGLSLKVSSKNVPERLKNAALGCAECHTLRPEAHQDTFEHNGYDIHVVVSPKDCGTCHSQEAEQFGRNLMSHAHGNLVNNGVYQLLVRSINDTPVYEKGKMSLNGADQATEEESCLYCHVLVHSSCK